MLTRCLALLLVSAAPAIAQEGRLVAAISGDWNGDDELDAATITVDAEGITEFILYRGDSIDGLRPEITLHDVFWAGTMAGTLPAFQPRSDTSFAIQTQQTAIGRSPWVQHLTIAYRNGAFVVAGYDYDTYDRIDPDHFGNCSVNLLTGRYELRVNPEGPAPEYARSGETTARAIPLAELNASFTPDVCLPAFD